MVRTYQRKTNRGKTSVEVFQEAANLVINDKMSIRDAASRRGINFMTLHRYIKKLKANPLNTTISVGYAKPSKVFSDEEEHELAKYVEHCSKIYYGMTTKDLRKFAFDLAVANKNKFPEAWRKNELASKDWLKGYLKRHKNLSIRSPEATSLARATAFNRANVNLFFDNLGKIYDKFSFSPSDVYNMDETGLTTVQKPKKIIAKKGSKQVGAVTSGERGTLVTMALAVNAIGNYMPPMLIFPRQKVKPFMTQNAPPGSVAAAHSSGWMTAENFLIFIEHFSKFTRCTKEKPVLLVLDNHSSHLSIPVLNHCKQNGITLLSFPPHTSHRLQPLDRTVYGPLKEYFNVNADGWLKSHPGVPMTIYDIPVVLKEALPLAATPRNIQKGFSVTGIWPFNREIFTEDEFLPSEVTNREIREDTSANVNNNGIAQGLDNSLSLSEIRHKTPSPRPSTSNSSQTSVFKLLTPQELKPFPKALPRKGVVRRKHKSAILTDTPEKMALEKEAQERENRKKKNLQVVKNLGGKNKEKSNKHAISSDEEDDDELCLICLEPFSQTKTNEQWIQCTTCKGWAHVSCGKNDDFYVCIHCSSDSE